MPGFDKTGPIGQGSMTGRRMGNCVEDSQNPNLADTSEKAEREPSNTQNFFGRRQGLQRGKRGNSSGNKQRNRFSKS